MNSQDILEQAARLVNQDRRDDYGAPGESFKKIAQLWSIIFNFDVEPYQVALCMIQLKIVRAMHDNQNDDSWVDIAGYAALGSEVSYE